MGFAASAGWAQALTDKETDRAGMPQSRCVRIDDAAPMLPPFWGSVVNDVWVVEAVALGQRAEVGPCWRADVDRAWASAGIQSHPDKIQDGVLHAEILGY